MERTIIVVFGAALLLLTSGILYVPISLAHAPWDQFDNTRFAPIERTKREIGLERVAIGLTAPLKGVVAPGLPNHLFVIDQPGQIWAIDLTATPRPVECSLDDPTNPACILFHDVSADLVTLGCVPAQTRVFGGSFDERGLLGLAFHPDFASNGKFYTYTSEPNANPAVNPPTFPTTLPDGPGTGDHQNVVAEWQAVNPGNPIQGVDANSRRELIRVDWPQFNHDGGDLAFRASDGTLFISMGDGGGADDRDGQNFGVCGSDPRFNAPMVGHGPDGNGQKLTNPLGKILRIDVDGNSANGKYGIPANNPFVGADGGVIEEIFAFGFRNPYRFSFDMKKKKGDDLIVGNVGQNDIEEVEFVESGANHGWPIKEGTLFFDHGDDPDTGPGPGFATPIDPGNFPIPPDLVDPIAQYDTHHEGHSVIAGFAYRGAEVSDLRARFIFGDFSRIFRFPIGPQDHGRLFYVRSGKDDDDDDGLRRITELRIVPQNALLLALLGWGQDAKGELYPLGNISGLPFFDEGVVLKIVPAPEAETDDD